MSDQGEPFEIIHTELDAYGRGKGGYGLNIEGSYPLGLHIMCAVFSREWLRSQVAPQAEKVTDYAHFRAVLAWLEKLREPTTYHEITPDQARLMATHNPPGHKQPGTEGFLWRGADWREHCPLLLGKDVQVSLAQALPENEPFSFPLLFKTWRLLAMRIQAGPIIGEPSAEG